MHKVYLSQAQHKHDNSGCVVCGSENNHCKQYMDIVQKYLEHQDISFQRVDSSDIGTLNPRINKSNAFGANIHYVAHTNAGGARGNRVYCWPSSVSSAQILVDARIDELLTPAKGQLYDGPKPKVVKNTSLMEIKNVKATTWYDEVLFHDSKTDMIYFHNNMQRFAKSAVRAMCKAFKIPFVDPDSTGNIKPSTPPVTSDNVQGDTYTVRNNLKGYYTAKNAIDEVFPLTDIKPGVYYIYKQSQNAINITTNQASPGSWINPKHNVSSQSGDSGANTENHLNKKLCVGDTVRYYGRLYANSGGGGAGKTVSGTYTVSRILSGKSHGILLNNGLGWVRQSDVKKV